MSAMPTSTDQDDGRLEEAEGGAPSLPARPPLGNLTTNSPAKTTRKSRGGRGRTRVPRPHRPAARPHHDQPSPPEDTASAGANSPGVAAAIQLSAPRGSALQQSPRDDDGRDGEDDISLGSLGSAKLRTEMEREEAEELAQQQNGEGILEKFIRKYLEFAASTQPASASDPDGDTHGAGDTPGHEGGAPGEDTPETESDTPGGDTPETEGNTPGTGGDTPDTEGDTPGTGGPEASNGAPRRKEKEWVGLADVDNVLKVAELLDEARKVANDLWTNRSDNYETVSFGGGCTCRILTELVPVMHPIISPKLNSLSKILNHEFAFLLLQAISAHAKVESR